MQVQCSSTQKALPTYYKKNQLPHQQKQVLYQSVPILTHAQCV